MQTGIAATRPIITIASGGSATFAPTNATMTE